MVAALQTLVRLDPGVQPEVAAMSAAIQETATRELRWTEDEAIANPPTAPADDGQPTAESPSNVSPAPEPEWRIEAKRLAPRRLYQGPSAASTALQAKASELLPALWAMTEQAGDEFHDVTALAEYWADGSRSIAAIADLISLEIGHPASDLPLTYFKLLAEAGFVELQAAAL
jgi:hypothetical protein